MGVNELAKRAGTTRQRLNKLVDRGKVTGVSRSVTGRLEITEGPELEAWLAERKLARALRKLQGAPAYKKQEFTRTIRTIELIAGLFHSDFKERFPKLYKAFVKLPLTEGLALLRADKKFARFRYFPVIEWAVSARTEESFQKRCAVVEFVYANNPWQFRNKTDIAETLESTRAAISKTLRLMPKIKPDHKRKAI